MVVSYDVGAGNPTQDLEEQPVLLVTESALVFLVWGFGLFVVCLCVVCLFVRQVLTM